MRLDLVKKKRISESNIDNDNAIENEYLEMFLSNNRFEGVDRDTSNYILRLLWDNGYVGAFGLNKVVEDDNVDGDENNAIFGIFSTQYYDYRGIPTKIIPILPRLISQQSLGLITSRTFENGKDSVVGYYENSRMPVKKLLENYLLKIVEIDNAVDFNREQLKAPWILAYSKNTKNVINAINTAIANNQYILGVAINPDELKSLQPLILTCVNNIAGLQLQREKYESKIKTLMGVDNINFEKRERLNTGEVEANNEEINLYRVSHNANMDEFCAKCNRLLGTNLSFNPEDDEKVDNLDEEKEDKEYNKDNKYDADKEGDKPDVKEDASSGKENA